MQTRKKASKPNPYPKFLSAANHGLIPEFLVSTKPSKVETRILYNFPMMHEDMFST